MLKVSQQNINMQQQLTSIYPQMSNQQQELVQNNQQQDKSLQKFNSQKTSRQRALRACDACRKMKIKCILNSGEAPCEACKLSARACKFEHVGVKREKPPSNREIEQLKYKISQLESVLLRLRPHIDLSSLPRTNDQAKTMAVALQGSLASPLQPTGLLPETNRLSPQSNSSPPQNVPLKSSVPSSINDKEELDYDSFHCEDDDSLEECVDENDDEKEFQSMLKSFGHCRIGTSHLLDHEKSVPQPPSQNDQFKPQEKFVSDHNIGHESLSTAEKYCLQRFDLEACLAQNWPTPDLANSLISIYFDTVFCHPPIVHQSEFKTLYQSGLANRDPQFAQLCFAIFAVASSYSDDPRVLHATQPDEPHPRQSAGALFAFTALFRLVKPAPLGLFELQTMAVMSFYLLKMSTPNNTSATIQKFMRKAISSGVHLNNSPQWNSSLLRDQLRKRAFFALLSLDKLTSKTHDYLRIPPAVPHLVEHPLYVDDAELDFLDAQDMQISSQTARKHFRERLRPSVQSPGRAAVETLAAVRRKLEETFQNMVLDQLSHHAPPSSTATPTSSTGDNPLPKNKLDPQDFLLPVVSLLGHVIENELPPLAKWNPSLTEKQDLHHTAQSTCFLRCLQIILLLQLVTSFPELSQTCYQAGCSMLDVIEDLKVLDRLNLLDAAIPHFLCPVGLVLLWVMSQDHNPYISADTQANASLKMKSCIEILNILAPTSFVAAKLSQKFTSYMERLVAEANCSTAMNNDCSTAKKSSKRPFSEIMAQKLQKPTVLNFLNSQSPPADYKSNDSHDDRRVDEMSNTLNVNGLSDIVNIVDSFQFPSLDHHSNPSAQAAIPIQNQFQVNSLNTQIQPQVQTSYPLLQLHDLFPCQPETSLSPPPGWNYENRPLSFARNQTLPTNENSSSLTDAPIYPVDGFNSYPSVSIGGGVSFNVPSADVLPSTTISLPFMPADRSSHLAAQGAENDSNIQSGMANLSQTTSVIPLNSMNPNLAYDAPFYVDQNNTIVAKNLVDSGFNPTTMPVSDLSINDDLNPYEPLAASSVTQDPFSTTINGINPSQLINSRAPFTNPSHHQYRQPQDSQDSPNLYTAQFGLKQSPTTLKPEPSSSDFNPSSSANNTGPQYQRLMQYNPLIDGSSTGIDPDSLSSTALSQFNQLDGSFIGGPTRSSFTTNTSPISSQRPRNFSSKIEELDYNYQKTLSSGVGFVDQKGFFNDNYKPGLSDSNYANRTQLFTEPTDHFSIHGISSVNNNLTSFAYQTNDHPPPGPLNSASNPNRADFNFDFTDPYNFLAQNDTNNIFSSICSNWLF